MSGEREMLKNVSSSNRQNQARRQLKMTADLDLAFNRETTLQKQDWNGRR